MNKDTNKMRRFGNTGPLMKKDCMDSIAVLLKSCTAFLIYRDPKDELGEDPEQLVAVGVVFTRGLASAAEREGYRVFEYHP